MIAVVGLCGTGKSEVVRLIQDHSAYERVYFGGQILAEMERLGLEVTPENERWTQQHVRQVHGMGAMAVLSRPAISNSLAAGRSVLIDGLYSESEISVLQEINRPLLLISVQADRKIRIARLAGRAVRPLSEADMDLRDDTEISRLEKAPPIVTASYHILNNGSLIALRSRVVEILSDLHADLELVSGHSDPSVVLSDEAPAPLSVSGG